MPVLDHYGRYRETQLALKILRFTLSITLYFRHEVSSTTPHCHNSRYNGRLVALYKVKIYRWSVYSGFTLNALGRGLLNLPEGGNLS
jgi:hypothetical protein